MQYPFRLRDEKYADREWWLYEININGIMCYTYYQARNVLDVLTESRYRNLDHELTYEENDV